MFHRITQQDRESMTGLCSVCGPVKIVRKSKGRVGCAVKERLYRQTPSRRESHRAYAQAVNRKKRRPYRSHLKEACERCGFVPEHRRQLDIHHIDHNKKNNSPENLKTLCANCHRLEHIPLCEKKPSPFNG